MPHPGCFTFGKETQHPLYRRLGGLCRPSVWVWKIFRKPGLELQAVHPVASCCADYTITHRSNIITECWVLRLSTPHDLKLCSWSLGNGSIETLDSMMQHSLSDELHFTLPTDPYLSPYWASDEVLRQLPPTKIMVSTIRYEKQMQK